MTHETALPSGGGSYIRQSDGTLAPAGDAQATVTPVMVAPVVVASAELAPVEVPRKAVSRTADHTKAVPASPKEG